MNNLKIKFKKLVKHAKAPYYSSKGDACVDLTAADAGYRNGDYDFVEYGTGICVEIPENYVGLVFPRSSISKTPHMLCNSVGIIDSGYRGEIKVRFKTEEEKEHLEYAFGDRIAQLLVIPYPKLEFEEVKELSKTERGTGGFGSTDQKNKVDLKQAKKEIESYCSVKDLSDSISWEEELSDD